MTAAEIGASTPANGRLARAVLVWVHLGPYHLARAAAASGVCDLTVIELASAEREAGWSGRETAHPCIVTLADTVWERQSVLAAALRLWRALDRLQPEVLFLAGYWLVPFIAAALWGRVHRRRNILLSDSTMLDRPRPAHKEHLKSVILSLYDRAIVAGRRQQEYLERLGFDGRNIGRPYDVVDNDWFSRTAAFLRINSAHGAFGMPDSYFLFVGRLIREKNLEFLIDAFAAYRARGGEWDLVLVGEGPLREDLVAHCDALGIANAVHFTGRRSGVELVGCYAFAGCFVLPSVSETWGLVVNEAMACSLPVLVSSRCGCADDLVEPGENGFVFQPTDEAALVDRLLQVSAMPTEQRRSMGAASAGLAGSCSLDAWAQAVRWAASCAS